MPQGVINQKIGAIRLSGNVRNFVVGNVRTKMAYVVPPPFVNSDVGVNFFSFFFFLICCLAVPSWYSLDWCWCKSDACDWSRMSRSLFNGCSFIFERNAHTHFKLCCVFTNGYDTRYGTLNTTSKSTDLNTNALAMGNMVDNGVSYHPTDGHVFNITNTGSWGGYEALHLHL